MKKSEPLHHICLGHIEGEVFEFLIQYTAQSRPDKNDVAVLENIMIDRYFRKVRQAVEQNKWNSRRQKEWYSIWSDGLRNLSSFQLLSLISKMSFMRDKLEVTLKVRSKLRLTKQVGHPIVLKVIQGKGD